MLGEPGILIVYLVNNNKYGMINYKLCRFGTPVADLGDLCPCLGNTDSLGVQQLDYQVLVFHGDSASKDDWNLMRDCLASV